MVGWGSTCRRPHPPEQQHIVLLNRAEIDAARMPAPEA
jgi:hypothetical protein